MQTRIDIADGIYLDPDGSRTRVRGGGVAGGKAWMARITEAHPTYGLDREFVGKDNSGLSGAGKSGYTTFDSLNPGCYEYRGFAQSSRDNASGFVQVHDDGSIAKVTQDQVLAEVSA